MCQAGLRLSRSNKLQCFNFMVFVSVKDGGKTNKIPQPWFAGTVWLPRGAGLLPRDALPPT